MNLVKQYRGQDMMYDRVKGLVSGGPLIIYFMEEEWVKWGVLVWTLLTISTKWKVDRESQYTYSRAGELQGGRLAHSVQSTQDVAR